jgi:NodT family efflux transporter outer membrane factor (OMF) lipoprotein
MFMRPAFTALVALLLAGCAVGPDHQAPPPSAGAQGQFQSAGSPAFAAAPLPADWWRLYRDPMLDRLIGDALAANKDLAVAAANLTRTRAVLSEARTARLPSTVSSGGVTYGRQSTAALGGAGFSGAADDQALYDVGLDASYEIDLYRRVGRLIEAARADAGAAEAALDVTRVAVVGETARAYANSCSATEQLAVARRTLALQDDTLRLTTRTLEAGRGTRLDVTRAQAARDRTAATIPPLEAQRAAALFRLATLTGRTPAELPADAAACEVTPRTAQPIPVGDGAELIRRRPDIRQAERSLAAATARIGVAVADLYPQISIGGSVGLTSTSLDGLGDNAAFRWGVGPLISWSFPNIGVARARVRQAEASAAGALASFDRTLLGALEEAETALTSYARELDRRTTLVSARDASRRSVDLARMRYRNGIDSFLNVLDAERTLAESEAALVASDAQIADNQITLFKALGGGWEAAAPR